MPAADQRPILVGVAQSSWRNIDFERTPIDVLAEVVQQAIDDSSITTLSRAIDAIVNIRFIADTDPGAGALFPRNPGAAITERLGLQDPALYLGAIGGNTPQYLVNRCAEKLMAGDHRMMLLCGAELMATFFAALKQGGDISGWAQGSADEPPQIGETRDGLSAQETQHGLYEPINTYPLFENSLRHHLGHSREQHNALIAQISARMSAVAANNPHAWRQQAMSAEDISTVARHNRIIGYPYTRAMNAALEVDMAAAVIMTTVGTARELGIPEERWIYYRGGADVNDIWHPSERADLHSSPAIRLAWETVAKSSGMTLDDLSHFDIYSCFPSAVQVSCDALGLSPLDAREVTVTGGLPYFGGPGNNYSLHAIAQMVECLRDGGGNGLVTANGLYLTKHSLGIYSANAGEALPEPADSIVLQAQVEAGKRVPLAQDPRGDATVETYTVAFDRDGPKRGIVIARNGAGERVVANTVDNIEVLEHMLTADPIGTSGRIRVDGELNIMEF